MFSLFESILGRSGTPDDHHEPAGDHVRKLSVSLKKKEETALAPPASTAPVSKLPDRPLLLDLGCGNFKKEGYLGVDRLKLPGVDVVCELSESWPWEDSSVDEVNAAHILEHFLPQDRLHFFVELFRVLKPGARAIIRTPHWSSQRAYGDMDHKWPPVCELFYKTLDPDYRKNHQPYHVEVMGDVNFETTWSYELHSALAYRSNDNRNFAISWYKEACQDLIACVTSKKKPKP